MKKILIVVGGILSLIVLYAFFLWISYIDDIVTSGEAYGFKIGDTKIETYTKAREVFKGERVYILHPVRHDMFGPHYKINFTSEKYPILSDRAVWRIYMDEGFSNEISLKFCDEVLVEIYRHRKYFEGT